MVFATKEVARTPSSLLSYYEKTDDKRNILSFSPPRILSRTDKGPVNSSSKPVSLLRYLVTRYSKPRDIVIDMLAGLSPLSEASILENRHCIVIERDHIQHRYIVERIRKAYQNVSDQTTDIATDGTEGDMKASLKWSKNNAAIIPFDEATKTQRRAGLVLETDSEEEDSETPVQVQLEVRLPELVTELQEVGEEDHDESDMEEVRSQEDQPEGEPQENSQSSDSSDHEDES
jgi:hypothetical protein